MDNFSSPPGYGRRSLAKITRMKANNPAFVLMTVMCLAGCDPNPPAASDTESSSPMPANPATFKIARPASNDNLAFDVLDVIWENADFYSDEPAFIRSVDPATKGQLGIYAATWYISEVNNGGHHQFFYNSTGMVWQQALDGFTLLGAEKHKAILQQAINLFPNSQPSTDRQLRYEQLEAIDNDKFDPLDDQLYDLTEDFNELAIKYIDSHPDEFFIDP
jgi:hypothetical protein